MRDGKLVAAAEEERFRRVKHWAGFPAQSVAYCLQEAGLRLADVNHVAVNQDDSAQRLRKIAIFGGPSSRGSPRGQLSKESPSAAANPPAAH